MKIAIIGNGGHSKVIQDMVTQIGGHEVIAILDDKYEITQIDNGVTYANISYTSKLLKHDIYFIIAVGNNEIRKKVFEKLHIPLAKYLTIIHPTAVVSPKAFIGYGTVVMPQAIINTSAVIGSHCIINSGTIVEHDAQVHNYSHISPNVALTGNVSIGEGVHVGASATIIPGIAIGNWSVIGAGSTVIQNIPAKSKAVGSPTRLIEKKIRKQKTKS